MKDITHNPTINKDIQVSNGLTFSLDTDGIEAKTLSKILYETYISLKGIGTSLGSEKPEIKIYPFKQGSFEYTLAVIALAAAGMSLGKEVLATFREVLAFKRDKIKNRYKDELSIYSPMYNKYAEGETGKHINELLRVIAAHTNGMKLKDEKGRIVFSANKKELEEIIDHISDKIDKVHKRVIIDPKAGLYLVKQSTLKYGLWEFIYNDNRISVELNEKAKKWVGSQKIAPGSKVLAELRITQEYNEEGKAWENKKYRITSIQGTVPPDLFDSYILRL